MADSTKPEGENAGEQANPAASTVAQETSPSPPERDDSPENQGSESRCENDDEDYVVEEDDDDDDDADKKDAATDATADSAALEETNKTRTATSGPVAVVSTSKKTRPSYKFDPDKITLRFLFANRDGLTVTIECQPSDTVGEVKGALMSVWPSGTICDTRARSTEPNHLIGENCCFFWNHFPVIKFMCFVSVLFSVYSASLTYLDIFCFCHRLTRLFWW